MTAAQGYDKPLVRQLAWFGVVGCIGFSVDAAGYLLLAGPLGLAPLLARLLAFVPATIATWALNRGLAFSRAGPARWGAGAQYLRYLAVQGAGMAVNYGVFYLTHGAWPALLALALGSVAAMAFNFAGSRWLVFAGRG